MTGQIYFNNVEVLSYNHNLNHWGAANNYANSQVYNIRSRVTGQFGLESISGVWLNSSGIINYLSSGLSRIYINNVDIGLGRVSSLNFDQGIDVQWKEYNATVEIPLLPGSGMFGTTGSMTHTGNYTGSIGENFINYFISDTGRYIKNFTYSVSSDQLSPSRRALSKNCSFSVDEEIEDAYGVTPAAYAKRLMRAIRNSYSDNLAYSSYPTGYPYPSNLSYTSQSFDIVNNQYSFGENYEYQSGLNYSWAYQHAFSFDGNLISVDEQGEVKSVAFDGVTPITSALQGWDIVKTGIYGRVSGVFQGYTGLLSYSGGCPLNSYPAQSSFTTDYTSALVNYSQSYTNSPFQQSGYVYSYSDSIEYDEEGYISVTENGNYKAVTNDNGSGFSAVSGAYRSSSGAIYSRLTGLYTGTATGSYRSCYLTGTLNQTYKQETWKEYDAEVGYQISLSENPNFSPSSTVYYSKASYSDNKPVHLVGYYPISYDSVLSQGSDQIVRGTFSNNIEVMFKDGSPISGLVAHALTRVRKPSGTDVYASDYSYSFSPLSKNFSLRLDYAYSKYRTKDNYLATWL